MYYIFAKRDLFDNQQLLADEAEITKKSYFWLWNSSAIVVLPLKMWFYHLK